MRKSDLRNFRWRSCAILYRAWVGSGKPEARCCTPRPWPSTTPDVKQVQVQHQVYNKYKYKHNIKCTPRPWVSTLYSAEHNMKWVAQALRWSLPNQPTSKSVKTDGKIQNYVFIDFESFRQIVEWYDMTSQSSCNGELQRKSERHLCSMIFTFAFVVPLLPA